MGSGKSFTAEKLSELLNLPFLDLDDFIEKKGGQSIATIFKFGGEKHFRQIETDALKSVIHEFPDHIIAAGGGTPIYNNNLSLMKEAGLTVYLDASIEVLSNRLANEIDKRPLLANSQGEELREKIAELLKPRLAYYHQCHIAVEIGDVNENAANAIAGYINSIR